MPHTRDVFRRLAFLGLALCVLIAGGTIAYALVEDRSPWDGFVWTVDTVATTGSIQAPQDPAGEVVKVILTFLGVGTLFYALVSLTELVVTGELGTLLAERRTRKMTERLRDHYIVCGFGRVGRQVASDLRAAGALYVVIDADARQSRGRLRARRALHPRPPVRRRGAARRRHRPRPGDHGLRGLRRREHLHRADRARAARRTSRSSPAPARRRTRRSCAAPASTASSRPTSPPAPRWRASRCTQRDRHDGRRRRVPAGGDHRAAGLRRRRPDRG